VPQKPDTDKAPVISHLRIKALGCGKLTDSHHASYRPNTTRILRVGIVPLRPAKEQQSLKWMDREDWDVKTPGSPDAFYLETLPGRRASPPAGVHLDWGMKLPASGFCLPYRSDRLEVSLAEFASL
jgi:hypothetical protein